MTSPDRLPADAAASRSSRSSISVALLAGIACVPLVVAAGFLTDRPPEGSPALAAVPGDISVLALRGDLDAAPGGRPAVPMRAGY